MEALIAQLLSNYGGVGIVGVIVLLAFGWVTKQWMNERDKVDAEKEKRINDHQAFFTAQSSANREVLTGIKTAVETMMDAYRDRGRQ